MKLRALLLSAITVLVLLTKATAATYSLGPVADARVIHGSGFDTGNYSTEILSVYTSSSGIINTQRTFIRFDLSSIPLPLNAHVDSAILTLTASTAFGTNSSKPMEVYRVLSPWTETGLTWLNRDATHAWTNAGGDFAGTNGQPYAVSTSSPTNSQAVTWDVTTLVREWLTNSATNFGLLLKSADGNQLTFPSRETGTATTRPNLTVIISQSQIQASSSAGQVTLRWTGSGVLQEKTNLNPAIAWGDSGRSVTPLNGTNTVNIPGPSGNNFFRLRGGP